MSNTPDEFLQHHLARVQRHSAETGDSADDRGDGDAGYPGSKAAGGVAERIIGQMPPHRVYVEAFAGHAAVFRLKRPAKHSLLIDLDPSCCKFLGSFIGERADAAVERTNAIAWAQSMRWNVQRDWLIYLDPPYLLSTRTCKLYQHELFSEAEHTELLQAILALPCMVMISGYESWLYDSLLADWRRVQFPAMTRGGPRTESLWCNFEEPELLHDVRFAGNNYRERENFKRKAKRWAAKFAGMSRRERQLVAAELAMTDRQAVELAMFATLPVTAAQK